MKVSGESASRVGLDFPSGFLPGSLWDPSGSPPGAPGDPSGSIGYQGSSRRCAFAIKTNGF